MPFQFPYKGLVSAGKSMGGPGCLQPDTGDLIRPNKDRSRWDLDTVTRKSEDRLNGLQMPTARRTISRLRRPDSCLFSRKRICQECRLRRMSLEPLNLICPAGASVLGCRGVGSGRRMMARLPRLLRKMTYDGERDCFRNQTSVCRTNGTSLSVKRCQVVCYGNAKHRAPPTG